VFVIIDIFEPVLPLPYALNLKIKNKKIKLPHTKTVVEIPKVTLNLFGFWPFLNILKLA